MAGFINMPCRPAHDWRVAFSRTMRVGECSRKAASRSSVVDKVLNGFLAEYGVELPRTDSTKESLHKFRRGVVIG